METISRCHKRPNAEHTLAVLGNCYVVQHHAIEMVCVEHLWSIGQACCFVVTNEWKTYITIEVL